MVDTANQLDAIDNVVVLMLASRAFDHMLGFLYTDEGNVSPSGQQYEGLTGKESNPDSSGRPVPVFRIEPATPNAYFMPGADPGEGYPNTNSQLFGDVSAPSSGSAAPTNLGFVKNFAATLAWQARTTTGWSTVPGTVAGDIMGCFTPAALPVLSGLARGYAVCDLWFASVPTLTLPNRAFACAATSQGHMDNKTRTFTAPTIFGLLSQHGLGWAMYGYNSQPLTRSMFADVSEAPAGHFGLFRDFQAAAAAGTLPAFTYLEPSWSAVGNSQHPPYSVALGEQLIHDVYRALRDGPGWAQTLLVITYDQHGGCYDHVPPPSGAVPPDASVGQFGFDFTRFGVRVPAVLVSPLITPGSVYRVPDHATPLDHTSILKTIETRWGLPPLTARDAAAPSLAEILTLRTPRSDDPLVSIGTATAEGPDRESPAARAQATLSSRLAAYVPDTVDGGLLVEGHDDVLGIRADVDVLADVIASSRITPPMSIGIFGDWGAGKSFLLNQLRLRVAQLTAGSALTSAFSPPGDVYCRSICQIEFNAWQYASGQQLWASLVSKVFQGIHDYLGGDDRWKSIIEDLKEQTEIVGTAEKEYQSALSELSIAAEQANRDTIADLQEGDSGNERLRRAADEYVKAYRLDKDQVTISDVEHRVKDLSTLGGRLRHGWLLVRRRRPIALTLLGAIVVALLVGAAFLPGAERIVVSLGAVVSAVIAIFAGITKITRDVLRDGDRLISVSKGNKIRYEKAQSNLEDAQAKLQHLRNIGATALYSFVEERYKTDDYRKYLGMVPLVRGDLERLSDLGRSRGGDLSIDRIVLYIDDLDRCPADQVVKVLEAVNLLFGFSLFVVLIAVDSRWLLSSLAREFSTVFQSPGPDTPTPQDYLEKIIQIPFWVRPMDDRGFGRLMDNMTTGAAVPVRTPSSRPPGPEAVTRTGESTGGEGPPTGKIAASSSDRQGSTSSPGTRTAAPDPLPTASKKVSQIVITEDELAFLRQLSPLVATPRAAKRLFNAYQLVRASLKDLDTFMDRREYCSLLVLLALVTGSPGISVSMVRSFFDSGAPDLGSFLQKVADPADPDSWGFLAEKIKAAKGETTTVSDFRRWLPVVGRYSFRPGLADAAGWPGTGLSPRWTLRPGAGASPATAEARVLLVPDPPVVADPPARRSMIPTSLIAADADIHSKGDDV